MKRVSIYVIYYLIEIMMFLPMMMILVSLSIQYLGNSLGYQMKPDSPDSRTFLDENYYSLKIAYGVTLIDATILLLLSKYADFRRTFLRSNLKKAFLFLTIFGFYYMFYFSSFGEWFAD